MTPKTRVLVKSMEKTTRMFLTHLLKRYESRFAAYLLFADCAFSDPSNPVAGRIQQYIERLMRSRTEIFDEAGRKRALADQAFADYGDAKRQRLDGGVSQLVIPPLGPGPHSLAAVFTLTNNPGLQGFDARQLPADLAAKISVRTLAILDQQVLDLAVSVSLLDTHSCRGGR